uniref:Phosphodiesterase n=1 Tax=Chromera velia CCMP2878 TaxID=1169474 RepID=A0A0G4HUE8_9ALVE|eukprot:Cvel_8608.t1-p1 / transcript=Cvel_8608.t1 / gene=Cvel_8608 / organism=Chromera_velia_CCMP2878 / gene_product=cAMP-specific 3',5'-cyclic phosphodiesterase 4D, putative / transcript_product=cAMP-specific 3',5'-cyclic phosphodiesterase 4D, putative / location=Cvel_scaffold478:20097-34415(-) / protein_length=1377 / sequence_SO=supercontig / SO=protein_coding / is_pseudo=false
MRRAENKKKAVGQSGVLKINQGRSNFTNFVTLERRVSRNARIVDALLIAFTFMLFATAFAFGVTIAVFAIRQKGYNDSRNIISDELVATRRITSGYFAIYDIAACDNSGAAGDVKDMLAQLREDVAPFGGSLCGESTTGACEYQKIQEVEQYSAAAGARLRDGRDSKDNVYLYVAKSIYGVYNATGVCASTLWGNSLNTVATDGAFYEEKVAEAQGLIEGVGEHWFIIWLLAILCVGTLFVITPAFVISVGHLLAIITRQFAHSWSLAQESDEQTNRKLSSIVTMMVGAIGSRMLSMLHVISGCCTLLTSCDLPMYHQSLLKMAEENASFLLRSAHSAVDFVTAEADVMPVSMDLLDIRACVEECLEVFSHKALMKGIGLSVTFGTGCPHVVLTDERKLRQILLKTLDSSVEYTDSGEVHVFVVVKQETPATQLAEHQRRRMSRTDPADIEKANMAHGSSDVAAPSPRPSIGGGQMPATPRGQNQNVKVTGPSGEASSPLPPSGSAQNLSPSPAERQKTLQGIPALGVDGRRMSVARTNPSLDGLGLYEIQFEVKDTGKGIANSQVDDLLEPKGLRGRQGMGLRMVVSRLLVSVLGGQMEVISSKERGTTSVFTMRMFGRSTWADLHPDFPLVADRVATSQVLTLGLPHHSRGNLSSFLSDCGISFLHCSCLKEMERRYAEQEKRVIAVLLGDYMTFSSGGPAEIFASLRKINPQAAETGQFVFVHEQNESRDAVSHKLNNRATEPEPFVRMAMPLRSRFIIEILVRSLLEEPFETSHEYLNWAVSLTVPERRGLRKAGGEMRKRVGSMHLTTASQAAGLMSVSSSGAHKSLALPASIQARLEQPRHSLDAPYLSKFQVAAADARDGKREDVEEILDPHATQVFERMSRCPPPPHLVPVVNSVVEALNEKGLECSVGMLTEACLDTGREARYVPEEFWSADVIYEADRYYGKEDPFNPTPISALALQFATTYGDVDEGSKDPFGVGGLEAPARLSVASTKGVRELAPDVQSMNRDMQMMTTEVNLERLNQLKGLQPDFFFISKQAVVDWFEKTEVIPSEQVLSWEYDILALSPKQVMRDAYELLKQLAEGAETPCDPDVVGGFLMTVFRNYHPQNSYHNFHHGFSVMQVLTLLMRASDVRPLLGTTDEFHLGVGALCHDIDHPGVNNVYLSRTGSFIARVYSEIAVLESHHAAMLFEIIKYKRRDIFQGVSREVKAEHKKGIIEAILATDMAKHFDLVKQAEGMLASKTDPATIPKSTIRQWLMHAADISNPILPFHLYRPWALRIVKEFVTQNKMEAQRGLPISMPNLKGHDDLSLAEAQLGFIGFICAPFFKAVGGLFPAEWNGRLEDLNKNIATWTEIKEKEKKKAQEEGGQQG